MRPSRFEKRNTCFSGPCRIWAAAVLTAGFLFFQVPYPCMGMADTPAPASQNNQDHPRHQDQISRDRLHYQEQVAFISEQISRIRKELEWLTLKVGRMADFDRFVPRRMHDSIAFKQSKIASLEKLKKRYQDLILALPEYRTSAVDKIREENIRTGAVKKTDSIQPMADTAGFADDGFSEEETGPGASFRQQLEKQMAAAGLDAWLEVVPHTASVGVETRLPILFSSASAQIPKGYEPFLKNLADLVRDHDVRIVVDGYADTDPINTEAYPSNFELGAARAAAVVRALVRHGVKPQVCKIGSTGQYRFDAKKQTEWKNLQRHATIAVFFVPNEGPV
ncbi:MAG TPA: OmpA family protein [Desulfotignum sp.]|nr:OmpA family protein [Desulfotignum sp.]